MKKLVGFCAALAALGLVACGGAQQEAETGDLQLSVAGPNSIAQVAGALRQAATSGSP